MASESTAASRLAYNPPAPTSSGPRLALTYQPASANAPRTALAQPFRPQVPGDTAPASTRPALPSQQKSNRPKHWIDIRALPESHPNELFPPAPGYANPLA